MSESASQISGVEGTGVTEEEVAAALGVNSVPDEVRVTSTDPDETGLVVDGAGELRPPSDGPNGTTAG